MLYDILCMQLLSMHTNLYMHTNELCCCSWETLVFQVQEMNEHEQSCMSGQFRDGGYYHISTSLLACFHPFWIRICIELMHACFSAHMSHRVLRYLRIGKTCTKQSIVNKNSSEAINNQFSEYVLPEVIHKVKFPPGVRGHAGFCLLSFVSHFSLHELHLQKERHARPSSHL